MTLKELKQMVAEEFTAYKKTIKEQPAGGPTTPPPGGPEGPEPTIAVSDDDIDVTGADDAEGTLKDIFDMLKDFFEGEKDKDDDGADDTKSKDDKGDDDKEDEEVKESPQNSGYTSLKENKSVKHAKILKEVKSRTFKTRLQKLANIK